MKITTITALEVLDSRGNPTIEATVTLNTGATGSAIVPSGASTGTHETLELRDDDAKRYLGKGVQKAVSNVEKIIAPALKGADPTKQDTIDEVMIKLGGTPEKKNLGANAILAVSMAVVRAVAHEKQLPLYEYIAKLSGQPTTKYVMPLPMMNLLNGGRHARGSTDMQEYMIMPIGAESITEAIRWGAETFQTLGMLLIEKGLITTVGDEGGYAPPLLHNDQPLEFLVDAIERAGYKPGKDIAIALDPAATEFFDRGKYDLKTEGTRLTSDDMVKLYKRWINKYPILSIEDGLSEDDWAGFTLLTNVLGEKIQIVGDDLFVTNVERVQKGIEAKAANAVLVKLNQIGTVSETLRVVEQAKKNNWTAVISHRSGETEDSFIVDLAVGTGTGQIKTGSLCRSERIAKYNQLMRIEHELGKKATFAKFPFKQ